MKKETPKIIKCDRRVEDGIVYEYTLSSSRSSKVASFQLPLYSITVKMTRDGEISENSLDEIFADIGKASVFYEKLVKNLATPIDLPYILEDKITF